MKKVYRTLLVYMMIILSVFVLAACGKKDAGKKDDHREFNRSF